MRRGRLEAARRDVTAPALVGGDHQAIRRSPQKPSEALRSPQKPPEAIRSSHLDVAVLLDWLLQRAQGGAVL